MSTSIEIFRELSIEGTSSDRAGLREILAGALREPWSLDAERSEQATRMASGTDSVLAFVRAQSDGLPRSSLSIHISPESAKVSNVVPVEIGQLSIAQYNAILNEFASNVALPACAGTGFSVVLTDSTRTLENALSNEAAAKLRQFSAVANKSSRASHPTDERYWFDFVIAAHNSGRNMDASEMARWLIEVEGWSEDLAHDLAAEYEGQRALLVRYDAALAD